ncbi:MAG TPA: hypothetical protein VK594_05185, partial [Streptosporangiaceae bacterium]|nr:hypothetical protein [Streptosporangiaceae bacterium]
MNPALIASLAAAGLLAGWPQRAAIVRLAVPAGQPPPDVRPAGGRPAGVRTGLPALVPGGVT